MDLRMDGNLPNDTPPPCWSDDPSHTEPSPTPDGEEHVEEVAEIPFKMEICPGIKKVYRCLREQHTRVDRIEISLTTLSSQYGKMAADIKTLQTRVDKLHCKKKSKSIAWSWLTSYPTVTTKYGAM